MREFTIASFNVKNLIGPDQEYYRFERYTPEEYAWKEDWLADQMLSLNADITCFQEIFDEKALRDVLSETDARGQALNDAVVPGRDKSYRKKAIFRKLKYKPYDTPGLAFAPNLNDGPPGQRRPGLAVLSRFGFEGPPVMTQDLDPGITIPFRELTGEDGGEYRLTRLSRPILKVRIPVGDHVVSVFNVHLKSKLGEYPRPDGADFPPEANLLAYDAGRRAMGSLRGALRRMAEAWVLRELVLDDLQQGYPVMVLGDLNDNEASVSTEIIAGERPFVNYAWMRRHDAARKDDRYTDEEAAQIRESIDRVRLHSAEKLFVKKSLRDMVYTTAFGGTYGSIDQILMSRHFHPDYSGRIGEMAYFSVLNDHLTDGAHPEAPYERSLIRLSAPRRPY